MTPRGGISSTGLRRGLPIVVSAAAMTLLFAAQEVVRNVAGGGPANVARAIAFNGTDWIVWGLLSPIIMATARRVRLDGDTGILVRVVAWTAVGAFCCLVQGLVTGFLLFTLHLVPEQVLSTMPSPTLGPFVARWFVSTLGLNIVVFMMIVGLLHAALYYDDLRARRLREADLEARLAQSELKALRMQLQPHFLFNALHTVSALMLSDVASAHRVVAAIGDLLRWSIDHTAAQEVSLRQELAFADRYLEVQQARFRDRLRVERCIDQSCLDALVPSFVLQPLLENAIRHGVEPSPGGATIHIGASRTDEQLALYVRDDAPDAHGPRSPFAPHGRETPGIGLTNISGRLFQLYGERQRFTAGHQSAGGFLVSMSIPFRVDAASHPAGTNGRHAMIES